jgi:hypothetical protein
VTLANPTFGTIALLVAPIFLAGCAGSAPVAYTGIDSAALLQKDPCGDNHVKFTYTAPDVDLAHYTRVIVEPVAVYDGPDQQFGSLSVADRMRVADYMRDEFAAAAAKRFKPADASGADTLRLKVTLTGVETNVPVLSTVTKLAPAPTLLNLIQTSRGKEGTFAGSVSFEVQAYDSTTNRLLEAYVSKQYPFAENIATSVGALTATRAGVRNGADALVPELDRLASTAASTQAAR